MTQETAKASESRQEAAGADPSALVGSGPARVHETFRDAAMHLRRPFTPAALKWKVQSQFGTDGCLVVPYIDARLVVERLNLLVPHLWADDYRPLDGKFVRCDLTIDGITRPDVGEGSGKGGYSDALKRAAVKFGVGVSLYAIPKKFIWVREHDDYIELKGSGQKKAFVITAVGDKALRTWYGAWLEKTGIPSFGEPLDHGDVEDAVGDVDVPEIEQEPESDEPILQLLEGDDAEALREEARDIYQGIVEIVGRSAYPPGEFQSGLAAHGHSLEALEEFIAALGVRLGQAQESRAAAA